MHDHPVIQAPLCLQGPHWQTEVLEGSERLDELQILSGAGSQAVLRPSMGLLLVQTLPSWG